MSAIATEASEFERVLATYPQVFERPLRERALQWLAAVGFLAYLVFSYWFFDLATVLGGANWTRAGIELEQWVSYESRPEITLGDSTATFAFNQYDPFGPAPKVDWLSQISPSEVKVNWGGDASALASPAGVTLTNAGSTVHFVPTANGWATQDPLPAWVHPQEGGALANFGFAGSLVLDRHSLTVRRRFLGWANFLFDQDSKFANHGFGEVAQLIVSGPRLDASRSNLFLAWHDFLGNSDWQHGDVFVSLLQTIVMAFVGTLFASALAAPLSFLAARTVTRSGTLNYGLKRFFDFQRCVDIFIWALFFTRGFGPGPLAGISAIFFTDTGTLGKTFTEALENIDNKPPEGMRSLGASPLQVQRYGILPQVLPVFVSQTLYQWESNTRSATVIGAMGAGGIGLKLLEAMRTNVNWANVAYMVVLILIVVYVFDNISAALRRRLIAGDR